MNLPLISWKYLKAKPLNTTLNLLILSLGIAIIVILILLSNQLEEKLSKNAKGIDLVIGAKGSPLQLVLCNIFHIDFPTGNISLSEARKLASNPMVKKAILLALGDSYESFRIIGTNHLYVEHYSATIASGKLWEEPMEVTLGSAVAEKLQLKVGETFYGAHGMGEAVGNDHEEAKYKVAGILSFSNSVLDNLILTNIESVWNVHEHAEEEEHTKENHEGDHIHAEEKLRTNNDSLTTQNPVLAGFPKGDDDSEITSMLVKFKSPMAAITMPRIINQQTNMQAASPAFEIARLFSIMGIGVDMLTWFAYLMVFIAVLSIFIALYNALKERKYDLAVMRSLGSSRATLFILVIVEGVLISILSGVLGLLLGHAVLEVIGTLVEEGQKAGITGSVILNEEIYVFVATALLGVFTAVIPAFQAYRTDISEVLAQG
ncbi:ABC transporter permease [Chondrinema litorale]|uniref:ABC transporter permease n=1 Tax=Chondrinema litorale TaxID=2994555 RepID=UPI0025428D16|nr:FtsX-like permease family protein [Chondrinema litorale]UZR92778.1 FtsX-like permease family protein [Chondrinema litorale]